MAETNGTANESTVLGIVTLRHNGKLHHIGIGRPYAGTYVRLLVHDLDITIIDLTTGEILRELTLDPTRDYQPTGKPPGGRPKTTNGPAQNAGPLSPMS